MLQFTYLHQIDASNRAIKESNSRTVRLLFEFWYSELLWQLLQVNFFWMLLQVNFYGSCFKWISSGCCFKWTSMAAASSEFLLDAASSDLLGSCFMWISSGCRFKWSSWQLLHVNFFWLPLQVYFFWSLLKVYFSRNCQRELPRKLPRWNFNWTAELLKDVCRRAFTGTQVSLQLASLQDVYQTWNIWMNF